MRSQIIWFYYINFLRVKIAYIFLFMNIGWMIVATTTTMVFTRNIT